MRLEAEDPRLNDLLDRCDDLLDAGKAAPIEQLCADCPELVSQVKEHLEAREFMARWREGFERGEFLPPESVAAGGRWAATAFWPPPLPTPPAAEVHVGGWIGRYRLDELVGRGGMGAVYRGYHSGLRRVVALKLLPRVRLMWVEAVERFQREMVANGKLDHVNIVRCTDCGEFQGQFYLVMDFIDGGDLAGLAEKSGPMDVPQACGLAYQAALGLSHIHAQGIVHRDIKPSNLMLTRDGTVKVTDLGLALLNAEGETAGLTLTDSQTPIGTFLYMAPEQARNPRTVDARADIYSLGATLFKLLTGKAPFQEPVATRTQVLAALLEIRPAPAIASLRPDIPPTLASLIDRMLAKDRDRRPASAEEIAAALEPFTFSDHLGTGDSKARRASHTNVPAFRHKGPVLLGLAILAVSALGVIQLLSGGGQPPAAPASTAKSSPSLDDTHGTPSARPQENRPAPADDLDREVATLIVRLGGRLEAKAEGDDDEVEIGQLNKIPDRPFAVTAIYLGRKAVEDDFLEKASRLRELNYLELMRTRVTDAGVAHLARCRALKTLDLKELTGVSGRSLATVAKLTSLEVLKLSDTKLTDRELSQLQALKGLRILYLKHCGITNRGMAALGRLSSIETLDIRENDIDDQGLADLRPIRHPIKIWVEDTEITSEGIRTFRSTHPECDVDRSNAP